MGIATCEGLTTLMRLPDYNRMIAPAWNIKLEIHFSCSPVWQSCDNVLQDSGCFIGALRQGLGHLLCISFLQELFLLGVDLQIGM